jgi:hypothetical protein
VAGASHDERRALAALGGIAAEYGAEQAPSCPTEVIEWAAAAPRPPETLLDLVDAALKAGMDPFAEAYNACISAKNRRQLGTVFTPSIVVDHMLDLVDQHLAEPPACVIDPGAGVGAFTLGAARRWPGARIVAVDINIVTLGLLAARIERERAFDSRLAERKGTIDLYLADYLDELDTLYAEPAGPIVALGNPPYTRTQALSPAYKRRAIEMDNGMITSRHANLATLFQALTLARLRPSDLSCMVLPGSLTYTRAARDLRHAIWHSRRPVTVHRWTATARAFVGRNVQAAIVMIGAEGAPGAEHLQLARAESRDQGVSLLDEWKLSRSDDAPGNWYFRGQTEAVRPDADVLTDVARVRRGVATGANEFFFLDDATAATLPASAIVPAVPSLRRFSGTAVTATSHAEWGGAKERRWLLALDPDRHLGSALKDYVDSNAAAFQERHLCAQRTVWWAITDRPNPQILLSPLAKTIFKVVLNTVGAVPSNNLIGITVANRAAVTLATWLRSDAGQRELRRISRRYHGGSHKIEPGDLRRLQIPSEVAASLRRVSPSESLKPVGRK